MAKAHRLPSTPSQTIYFEPLELVYCDLWGPGPKTSSMGYNTISHLLMPIIGTPGSIFLKII